MSTRKSFRTPRKQAAGARSRTLLLPMPRDDAAKLVLRTRLALDRLRNGEADRRLINELSQIVLLTNFISEAGHSDLELAWLERVEGDLAGVLVQADATGIWVVPEDLVGDVTKVVNEYDRALSQTRLAVIVDACNRLERLIEANLKHQLAPVAGAGNPLSPNARAAVLEGTLRMRYAHALSCVDNPSGRPH